MKRNIKFFAEVIKWRDKVNGNTYHSVKITRARDGAVVHAQFQYGYGSQYEQSTMEALAAAKWIPHKYRGRDEQFAYERENNYPILYTVTDGLKRDCVANGRAN